MKIRKLTVKNFRGIRELEWCLPAAAIFCLIGKGDATKSTILDAIRYTFYPRWDLSLNDADFYQCNPANSIIIEATIGELIEEFCSLHKYGQDLRGWDISNLTLVDEPDDHLENVLTVRLTIREDLEPHWQVICDRNTEGNEFRTADRNKLSVELIGAYSAKQLSWANGTALSKLTDAPKLSEALANASRKARNSLDADRENSLTVFDEMSKRAETTAKLLGVPVRGEYKAQLDLNSINIKVGGLALHDNEMPLRQMGLGSRRMLLCGLQKLCLEEGHITLLDEIEFGLEPHRISRLIKHIKADEIGQYFLTTHSPIVLRELTIKELYVTHNNDGLIQIIPAFNKNLEEHSIQGKIRSSAEAFLAKRVIICEGATEVGFLRGFDDYQLEKGKDPFSYHGVALLDARGASKIKGMGQAFKSLYYHVGILADGDAPNQFSETDETDLVELGIKVAVWAEQLSLEERAMMDLPWENVLSSAKLANSGEPRFPVPDNVCSALGRAISNDIDSWEESLELRKAIGKAAKNSGWFKDVTRGDLWFKQIACAFEAQDFQSSDLAVKLNRLWEWAEDV